MPKRITRTKEQDFKSFRSGFNCGVSATVFAMQLKNLRTNKRVTLEDASAITNISVKCLAGLESANIHSYLSMDTEGLGNLAKYYDVAIDIRLKSDDDKTSLLDKIEVKTFQEEMEEQNENH